ncbi:trypsin-like peptidase domain-containing protein [Roseivivax marinus]|uniref:S1C family serine protease n=1 Tax=Roseivivax marinus TaxID=1379903 RepID=UPI001F033ACE|nr:trypsin-like peptidase domain-containing protein [Roseivivax marinus]UMA65226.1 trypsin-like peptidase domain-containing protein [Roseivivax marinus]
MTRLADHPRRVATGIALAAMVATGGAVTLGQTATPAEAAPTMGTDYVDLVKELSPAVVTIEVTKTRQNASMQGEMPQGGPGGDFPWEEFMKRFGMPNQGGQMPHGGAPSQPMQGAGTGFVISEDGRIVTNAHVVSDADEVTVTLEDGREFEAEVLGVDEATDLAVIEIDADDLTHVSFGDSTTLQVGQNVIAMGNPFGLGNTVTTGIVSALGRDLNAGPFDDFIQTDAAINRGNSGGPLFNEQGQVVGVNTAIISPTGGSVGIGFSVPSELASEVVADLVDDGAVERGWLGVQIKPLSEDVARALGFDNDGVMIEAVQDGTPAEEAGLEDGDIVTRVDGEEMTGPRDLTRAIAVKRPGASVEIEVLRRGDAQTFTIELGNRADMPA